MGKFKFSKGLKPDQKVSRIPLFKLFYICLGINGAVIAAVFLLQKSLPPQLPLYYGLPEGEEQLSQTLGLTIPSFLSVGVTLVNTLVALIISKNFLKQALMVSSLGVTILSLVTTIKIFFLIGNL